jgi:hypothetical protein
MLLVVSLTEAAGVLHHSSGGSLIPFQIYIGTIGTSRLYWYRGVTVLLPGWVIWKYKGFVHANLPIGRLTSVRTVDPHGENGANLC